jgi:hypothetical protein
MKQMFEFHTDFYIRLSNITSITIEAGFDTGPGGERRPGFVVTIFEAADGFWCAKHFQTIEEARGFRARLLRAIDGEIEE